MGRILSIIFSRSFVAVIGALLCVVLGLIYLRRVEMVKFLLSLVVAVLFLILAEVVDIKEALD